MCIGFLVCAGTIPSLFMLIRTVMTSPTLVVNADGILDNCSMIVTGRGLLRWTETLGVDAYEYSSNRAITYHFLDIDVTDRRVINRRQPLRKRALSGFVSQPASMGFRIPRPLLDRPPATLVTEINRYIFTHAPEGSWHKTMADDKDEQSDEE